LYFSCCGSVEALASAKCNEHVAEAFFRDRTRPHQACFARRPKIKR
jgi:hypothetical protein